VTVPKLIWAAVSAALAFGLNLQLRPHLDASFERSGQPEPQRGALTLADPALEIPTTAVHVVSEDLVRFGKVYSLREISVRSQLGRGAAPSCELFITLPDNMRGDPNALAQLELRVKPAGRFGARESFVQREAAQPGRVVTGSWQFTDIRESWDTGAAELQAEARIELQVETERGVDLLTGRWSGRLMLN
jgi:hypothetical protein